MEVMDEYKEKPMTEFEVAGNAILKTHDQSLDKAGRVPIHRSFLYKGKNGNPVQPSLNMSPERSIVRHLSTVLLCLHPSFIEVQAAVAHERETIHVSCNEGVKSMKKLIPDDSTLQDFMDTIVSEEPGERTTRGKRGKRHFRKLEIEAHDAFGRYKFVVTHPHGTNREHAETKIITDIGKHFDYIGDTRRPCTACFLFMQLKLEKTSVEKYNKHHGAFWNSKAALAPLVRLIKEKAGLKSRTLDHNCFEKILNVLKLTVLDNQFYYSEGLPRSQQNDFDTDSESE